VARSLSWTRLLPGSRATALIVQPAVPLDEGWDYHRSNGFATLPAQFADKSTALTHLAAPQE